MTPTETEPLSVDDQELLQRIVSGSTHGILLVNESGAIQLANDRACEIFGYDRDELLDRSVESLVPAASRAQHRQEREAYQQNPRSRPMGAGRDLRGLTKAGREIPLEIGLNPIAFDGKTYTLAEITDISERQSLRQELEEKKRRLEQELSTKDQILSRISNSIDQAFCMVSQDFSAVHYANPAVENLFGIPPEELYEDPLAWRRHIPAEDVADLSSTLLDGTGETDWPQIFEFRVHHPERGVRWIRSRVYPVEDQDRLVAVSTDITSQKQAHLQMEETLSFRDKINRQLPGAVYQLTSREPGQYEFKYLSPGFEELTGVPSRQLEKDFSRALDLVHPEDRASLMESLKQCQQNLEPWEEEFRYRHREGEVRWVLARAVPEQVSGGNWELSGFVIDVTRRKQHQKDLEQALEQKQVLLQEIHHRVKNNLQVISSILGLEIRESGGKTEEEILRDCRGKIQAMALIHQHLYTDDQLSGRVNLGDYLENLAYQTLKLNTGEQDSLDLETSKPGTLEMNLDTAIPLGLVINELITNSIQHGYPDPAAGCLSLSIQQTPDNGLRLEYRDDGLGLPEDFSLEDTDSLGLLLVRNLITRQLGGEVQTPSSAEGACFVLNLPRASRREPPVD